MVRRAVGYISYTSQESGKGFAYKGSKREVSSGSPGPTPTIVGFIQSVTTGFIPENQFAHCGGWQKLTRQQPQQLTPSNDNSYYSSKFTPVINQDRRITCSPRNPNVDHGIAESVDDTNYCSGTVPAKQYHTGRYHLQPQSTNHSRQVSRTQNQKPDTIVPIYPNRTNTSSSTRFPLTPTPPLPPPTHIAGTRKTLHHQSDKPIEPPPYHPAMIQRHI
ncbi:hypothetical protein C7212DRAFT_362831 [Tuber magnatum]|uniref:Uncharacterized protein n=1 Tax=Tuber magnatum TaxID=42249 RepID=A0A317SS21_9PEZI|nr:hypothetical protein C7212DRAFT_362831 [Tuber magnatum]